MLTEDELDRTDAATMQTHDALDTRPAHRMLTQQIWTALRGLGLAHGWVTCIGMDAATFTGHIAPEEYGETGSYAEWTGPIRSTGIYDAVLTAPDDTDTPLNAVIANLPYANLHLHSGHGTRSVAKAHEDLLFAASEQIAPGGFLVAVTTRQLMDQKDPAARHALAQTMDLVGALRLPGTLYHPTLSHEQTAPTDLLILRRRHIGEPHRASLWISSGPVVFPGGQAQVNTYFTNHYPHYVIGRVGFLDSSGQGGPRMTVLPSRTALEPALRLGMSQIVQEARSNGLTSAPPPVGPAPPGIEPGQSHHGRGRGPRSALGM